MKCKILLVASCLLFSGSLLAGTAYINGKTLSKVRVVGDYPGTEFDNSVELWFSTPIVWPATVNCTNTFRVYIDAKYTHLISAAYMALAAGKVVNVHVDDQLPNRRGSCEITYIDVIK